MAEGCSDSFYLYDCRNCSDCILSVQLRNKKYVIMNKQYSREEYEELKIKFLKRLHEDRENLSFTFEHLKNNSLCRNLRIINSENSTGDFINDSKNVINGFYVSECEDCVNMYDSHKNKNCYDNLANEKSELALECDTAYELYNAKFCSYTVTASDVAYLDQCIGVKDCFGCIGLKSERYVILNKKYTKEEYEMMLFKINDHMRKTGEFGNPFPANLSSFPYNLCAAYLNSPLNKGQAVGQGFMWHEESEDSGGTYADSSLRVCESTGKKYQIIPQERLFYEKFDLPLPCFCPEERYRRLCALQPPKKLHDSQCYICGDKIKTVYSSANIGKVVCGRCYLREIV